MVNTLGVLYLVTSGDTEINSVADLAGKTVVLLRPGARWRSTPSTTS